MGKVYLRCFVPVGKLPEVSIIAAREHLGAFAVDPEMFDQDDPHYWVYFALDESDVRAVQKKVEAYDFVHDTGIVEASELRNYIHGGLGVFGRPRHISHAGNSNL